MRLKISPDEALKLFETIENSNGGLTAKEVKSPDKHTTKTVKTENETISKEKRDLKAALDKIDADYAADDTRTYGGIAVPKLEKKTYDAPTDEQIESTAKAELESSADIKKNALKKGADEKRAALEVEIGDTKANADKKKKSLSEAYAVAKENAANEAIKRGIARSSIISEQLADFDAANIKANADIDYAAENSIKQINDEIENLSDKLSDALSSLDMETAIKVNERIRELKTERQKRSDEVLEYNNKIAEKKASVAEKLAKKGQTEKEENSDQYARAYTEKVNALYDYYRTFGDDAKSALAADKNFIIKYIGEKGYDLLNRYYE